MTRLILATLIVISLIGCAELPPKHNKNVCSIFQQYSHWYWATQKVEKRWHVPISVIMAFMYQESRFHAKARPPRQYLLGIIPWFRPSTSYGYAQALTSTWQRYEKQTGRLMASRTNFADAADFIGWYAWQAHKRAGISTHNAYAVYLAYHEGIGCYQRHCHRNKARIKRIARKVQRRANAFRVQLKRCQSSLPTKPWWHIW